MLSPRFDHTATALDVYQLASRVTKTTNCYATLLTCLCALPFSRKQYSALDSEGLLNVVVTMRELIEKTKRCASDRGDGAVVVA